ncbi:MAG TPA: alpha/beta hydrolase [Burkholderiales bacterium]|nr:alpha/beta hydrolase [Burkholderiales bacterium]
MVALVLLPGMDGTGTLFSDFVRALGADAEVFVVRYPAEQPAGYQALEQFVRPYLPTDRPFVLVAESFSGPIAISIAATAPEGLIALVLCCSFARNPAPFFSSIRQLVGLLPIKHVPVSWLSYFLAGRFSTPSLRKSLHQALESVSSKVLRVRARAVLEVDVSSKLKQINLPILYLRASEDRVVKRSASALIVRLAMRARIVELEAPHFLLQTAPVEAAVAIRRFISEERDC